MTLNTKAFLKAAGLYSAAAILIGAAWAFGDNTGYRPWLKREMQDFTAHDFQTVMDQTEQNTLAITRQEFTYIEGKLDLIGWGGLTWEEKRDYCKSAQILEYPVANCLNTGEPDLTQPSKAK